MLPKILQRVGADKNAIAQRQHHPSEATQASALYGHKLGKIHRSKINSLAKMIGQTGYAEREIFVTIGINTMEVGSPT